MQRTLARLTLAAAALVAASIAPAAPGPQAPPTGAAAARVRRRRRARPDRCAGARPRRTAGQRPDAGRLRGRGRRAAAGDHELRARRGARGSGHGLGRAAAAVRGARARPVRGPLPAAVLRRRPRPAVVDRARAPGPAALRRARPARRRHGDGRGPRAGGVVDGTQRLGVPPAHGGDRPARGTGQRRQLRGLAGGPRARARPARRGGPARGDGGRHAACGRCAGRERPGRIRATDRRAGHGSRVCGRELPG